MYTDLQGNISGQWDGREVTFGPATKAEIAAEHRRRQREFDDRSEGYRTKNDDDLDKIFKPVKEDDERIKEIDSAEERVKRAIQETVTKSLDARAKEIAAHLLEKVKQSEEIIDARLADTVADRVKAAIAELQPMQRGVPNQGDVEFTKGDNNLHFAEVALPSKKYYLSTEGLAGGRVDPLTPWNALVQMNPLRGDVRLVQLSGGTATLPRLGAISFSNETVLPTAWPRAGSATVGALSSANITLKYWVAETYFVDHSKDDVPMLQQIVADEMTQQWGFVGGSEIIRTAKTSVASNTAGTFAKVTSGTNDARPTAANFISKCADMIGAIGSPYLMGAKFSIGRGLHASGMKATLGSGAGYDFDPAIGMRTIEGFPVMLNDHCDNTDASGNVFGYFGNWMKGIVLAEGSTVRIAEVFRETRPGADTYFGSGRCVAAVQDGGAIVGMIEGA